MIKEFPNIDIKSADILDKHKSPAIVFDPQTAQIEYATPGKRTKDQSLRLQRLYLEKDPQGLHEAFDFTISKEITPINLSTEEQEKLTNYYFSSRLLPEWAKIKNILGELSFTKMSYTTYKTEQEIVELFWNENPNFVKKIFKEQVKNYVDDQSSISSSDKQQILDNINDVLKDSKVTPSKLLLEFNELKSNPAEFVKLNKIKSLVKNIDLSESLKSTSTSQKPLNSNNKDTNNKNTGWTR